MKLLRLTQMQMLQLRSAALKKPLQRASMQSKAHDRRVISRRSVCTYVRMYVSWVCTRMYLCIKIRIRLVLPPQLPHLPEFYLFLFFNFLISKIWRIFPKKISKISPIYTRKNKNGPFFFFNFLI